MILSNPRHLFEIPDAVHYLNCAFMAPQLQTVTQAGIRGVQSKSSPWTLTAPDFFETSERVRGLFARLLSTAPDNVALLPSVSYGVDTVAANLPIQAGQTIVILDEQFPSNVYPWRARAKTQGAQVVTAPRGGEGWTASVLSHIEDRTAVVALPACHWTDGTMLDLMQIGARCREVGAALVLDLTQSLGAMPFDLAQVQPDAVVSAAYKWLLGPYSVAFMYLAPHLHDGEPLEHNWIARERSEDFAGLVDYREGYQSGARRFDVGERSNFALMPMAEAALEQVLSWGVPNIAETISTHTARICDEARALGLRVLGPRGPHMLGLRFAGGLPPALPERLRAAQVFVSVRGDAIRVAPYVYNTKRDLDALFEVLRHPEIKP